MIVSGLDWTLENISRAVGGVLLGRGAERPIRAVATDTRDPLDLERDSALFVALKGEHYDAHRFLGEAAKRAAALLVSERGAVEGLDVPAILVQDTLQALGDWARAARRRWGGPVLAITGSSGKTTTKEMLAAALSECGPVLRTQGNFNNLIGVPLTLFRVNERDRVAVIEMGMNSTGELRRLAEIAEPEVGVVLNVGPAHIGELGSIDAVARAKGELLEAVHERGGILVRNVDDPLCFATVPEAPARTFGFQRADVQILSTRPIEGGQCVRLDVDGEHSDFELMAHGRHNALNLAGAIAVATAGFPGLLRPSLETLRSGLLSLGAVPRRFVVHELGPYTVIDDCYNANPASTLAAIDTARDLFPDRRHVALMGEMRELGAYADEAHRKVGAALGHAAIVASLGEEAQPLTAAASEQGAATHHQDADADAMWAWLSPRLQDGDVVLIKGSRGIKMERFVERFEGLL